MSWPASWPGRLSLSALASLAASSLPANPLPGRDSLPKLPAPGRPWAVPSPLPLPLLPPRWRNVVLGVAGAGAGTVGLVGMVLGAEVLAAKRRTILPETDYERVLRYPAAPGAEHLPPLRLAVLGDSTTTGVGTERVEDTYAASAGLALAERGPVEVHVLGRASSRVAHVLDQQLAPALELDPDLVLLVVGANDATHLTPFHEVKERIEAVLERLGDRPVVLAGVPTLRLVTVLASPLRDLCDLRGQKVNRILRKAAARHPNVTFVPLTVRPTKEDAVLWNGFLAADGFHPSAVGYARWACELTPALLGADPRAEAPEPVAAEVAVELPVRLTGQGGAARPAP
jgi:lysophospholipase L1-like esterase